MYYKDLDPGKRVLMGPGPSDVHPRVLKAMSTPLIGHLDPDFLTIMNETKMMLQEVFQTKNEFTIALSGTGSAGMEACLVNLLNQEIRLWYVSMDFLVNVWLRLSKDVRQNQ